MTEMFWQVVDRLTPGKLAVTTALDPADAAALRSGFEVVFVDGREGRKYLQHRGVLRHIDAKTMSSFQGYVANSPHNVLLPDGTNRNMGQRLRAGVQALTDTDLIQLLREPLRVIEVWHALNEGGESVHWQELRRGRYAPLAVRRPSDGDLGRELRERLRHEELRRERAES